MSLQNLKKIEQSGSLLNDCVAWNKHSLDECQKYAEWQEVSK